MENIKLRIRLRHLKLGLKVNVIVGVTFFLAKLIRAAGSYVKGKGKVIPFFDRGHPVVYVLTILYIYYKNDRQVVFDNHFYNIYNIVNTYTARCPLSKL